MTTERIQIVVTSAGAKAVRKDIEGLGDGADKAGKSLGSLTGVIKGLIAGAAVREVIRLADSYTTMTNRIRTVTRSTAELNAVQAETFRIAQGTRASLGSVTETYARLALATGSLGLSQRETLQLTESLNQAVAIGGSGAQEAENALRQLAQGLGAGALRGDEFNSVLENTPVIARVIAQELKVDVGALRSMAAEGKITADVVVKAFRNARGELADKFGKAVPTVSEALTTLMNTATKLVGELDSASGASSGLASTIIDVSTAVGDAIPELVRFAGSVTDAFSEMNKEATGFSSFLDSLGLPPALVAIELVLANIIDRFIAASKASAIFYRTVTMQGGSGDSFSAFAEQLKVAAITGNGGVTQGVLDGATQRRGTTTLNDEAGDPHNVLDRAGKRTSSGAAASKTKGATFAEVLRDMQREGELLRMNTQEREIQSGLDQAKERISAKLVSNQVRELRLQLEQNQALQRANDISQEMGGRFSQAMNDARDARSEAARQMSITLGEQTSQGMNAAAAAGGFADRSFAGASATMGEEQLASMRTFGEEMAAIFGPGGTLEQGFRSIGGSMADIIGHSIAFGASWEETGEAVKRLGQSIVAEVISSLIRIPIQLAINEAIASGLRAKATAETVAQAATTTAAMAPAAAATSLATAGTNSVGATAAIIGVSALAAGALVGAAMFKEGGYTGNGSRDGVAGLVHGREFVVNAGATARHRGQLEAMNAGRGFGGGGVQVTIVNQAGGVEFETRQIDDSHIEIIAKRIVQETAADVIASDLRSPQSKTGRAISQTTTASRRRA